MTVAPTDLSGGTEVLRVEGIAKHFGATRAVDGVTFGLREGETLGLVGESGSGKTTTARLVLRLLEPTSGRVIVLDRDVTQYSRRQMRSVRRSLQVVFQDPHKSLNPRMVIRDLVGEPLRIHAKLSRASYRAKVDELLTQVGLSSAYGARYAHELSGGQRQRAGIARALALEPRILILDEPVSALDVSIRAQVINLLMDLQEQRKLAYLFISHDLSVVRHIAHRVAVMYLGQIVEIGPTAELFNQPSHPYTRALLSAIPAGNPGATSDSRRIVLQGDPPNPADMPRGCRFHPRCFMAAERCSLEEPELLPRTRADQFSACHFAGEASSVPDTAAVASVDAYRADQADNPSRKGGQ